MIISLEEAKNIPGVSDNMGDAKLQLKLDALETTIRNLTHNNFQNRDVRYIGFATISNQQLATRVNLSSLGFYVGDIIQIQDTKRNNMIVKITNIDDRILSVDRQLKDETDNLIMFTKVEYPSDIKLGVINLLEYDVKMAGKIGIKSETVSRVSTTYYDVNSSENIEGYPSSLFKFVEKHMKLRWS